MRAERTEKLKATAFDGIAVGLSPVLIMGMITSLVFFLVIAFYRGDYDVRLMVILTLYTAATVLIARIAIESGRAHANLFSLPLGIVAMVAMTRFVTISGELAPLSWLVNIGLLALSWYLADRITFDCTLLEDDRESIQGGLLQTLGRTDLPAHDTPSTRLASKQLAGSPALKKSKHNPGVWVLYFALLAFPLFGLGQLLIPGQAQRSLAFWLLVGYLGCALSLLMTTSLLAMRRYLRQRGVSMPTDITARWLGCGVGLSLAILLLCMLLPLPGRALGLVGLPIETKSSDGLSTSQWAWGQDGKKTANHATSTQLKKQPVSAKQAAGAKGEGSQAERDRGPQNKANDPQRPPSRQQSDGQGEPARDSNSRPSDAQPSDAQPSDARPSDARPSDARPGDAQADGAQKGGAPKNSDSKGGDQSPASQPQNRPQNSSTAEKQSGTQPQTPSDSSSDTSRPRDGDNKQSQRSQSAEPSQGKSNSSGPANAEVDSAPKKQDGSQPQTQQPRAKEPRAKEPRAKEPRATDPSAEKHRAEASADNPREPEKARDPQNAAADDERSAQERASSDDSASAEGQANETQQPTPSRSFHFPAQLPSLIGTWFKWLTIAVLAAIVVLYVLTHPGELIKLWRELLAALAGLWGRPRRAQVIEAATTSMARDRQPSKPAFHTFANPFQQNLQGWQTTHVVEHTFAALEAWAAERDRHRAPDQTFDEFAKRLATEMPQLVKLPGQAASMLDRVMFAGWKPSPQDIAPLAELWRKLESV